MLAVFEESISNPPKEFVIHSGWQVPANRRGVAELFSSSYPNASFYNFGNGNFMALSNTPEDPDYARSIVAEDDIYCILIGNLANVSDLCDFYGVTKLTNEAMLVAEMYKVTRNFSYCPPAQLVDDFSGNFAFVLFDARSKTLFAGRDREGPRGVNLLWGMVDDRSLAFSDNAEVILDMCGRSTAYFPRGCIYMNETGLISYVHPRHEVKAYVNRDENGEPSSVSFAVDV